ncbi:MAG TPA: YhcH/YjgK/YiaL family protein [Bacteroidales bacterium]|nr:YhcH/YjgK/YiaL family protein [Bacteroidales bacterium]
MKQITSNILLIAFISLFFTTVSAQKANNVWNKKSATQWFNKGAWAGAMTLKVDKSVNVVDFANQYHQNQPAWDLVFNWLAKNDPTTFPVGKYVLDSANVSLTITDGPSVRPFEQTRWEAHCQKVDLQYIARGAEKMGIAPLSGAKVVNQYDLKKDVGFYQPNEKKAKYVVATPGTFLLFFPSDAHRPNIQVEGCDTVRKIVFKIRVVSK